MGYDYNYLGNYNGMVSSNTIWFIISIVVAVVGGLSLYFTFLSKNNDKQTGFLGKLYNLLTFKTLVSSDILKIGYLVSAIFITLNSFNLISISFMAFLCSLLLGNILLRILYEFALMFIKLVHNVEEINKKSKKD